MIRRRKIQARPNVASASSLGSGLKAEVAAVKSPATQTSANQQTPAPACADSPSQESPSIIQPASVDNGPNVDFVGQEEASSAGNDDNVCSPLLPQNIPDQQIVNSPRPEHQHQCHPQPLSPIPVAHQPLPEPAPVYRTLLAVPIAPRPHSAIELPPLMRHQSANFIDQIAPTNELSAYHQCQPAKKRKEPPTEKLCDTKTFTMSDLINWKPKTENSLRRKWAEKRKMLKAMEEEAKSNEEEIGSEKETQAGTTTKQKQPVGPRVKINEHGEMVVDEESLVLVENPENNSALETINDDYMPKKLTSMSFKKYKKGVNWSTLETDLFYEVLAATGTDFGLMHEFIPSRTRAELKQKFNREQRVNARRLDETLQNPVLLDERLRQRVERVLEEMAK